MFEIIKAVILGIIQGITEWLPISSTGHMILFDEFVKLNVSESFKELFFVVIQLGSIMAVVVLFFKKLNPFMKSKSKEEKKETFNIWFKVAVASIPAVLVGVFFDDYLEKFYNYKTVAIALILYVLIFIFIENKSKQEKIQSLEKLDYKTALGIGLFQVLAFIPGTSRSGSTIIGALLLGTSRYIAAEFTFFLAIPVMFGASFLKLIKYGFVLKGMELAILLTGSIVAFLVSLFVIRFFMNFVKKHDFKVFGYYRIILGSLILIYFAIINLVKS
jgi:undecaprenyl-diphosphatase